MISTVCWKPDPVPLTVTEAVHLAVAAEAVIMQFRLHRTITVLHEVADIHEAMVRVIAAETTTVEIAAVLEKEAADTEAVVVLVDAAEVVMEEAVDAAVAVTEAVAAAAAVVVVEVTKMTLNITECGANDPRSLQDGTMMIGE